MARILYGVMGNTYGHVMRSLAIAARMPEHEFYFVGGGRVPEAVQGRCPVFSVPVLRTVHRAQRVSVSRTIAQIVRRGIEASRVVRSIVRLIEDWRPDMAICDREFFLPLAARKAGLDCVSVDHSHVLKACRYPVPASQRLSWSLAMLNDSLFFDFTRRNWIVSFFHPPLKPGRQDELFGPVLRPALQEIVPSAGDYILVYQTSRTFSNLIETLSRLKRPAVIYGFHEEKSVRGNMTFKPYDPRSILEDLAGCAYAVANGGHNLICEALYFGKPVLSFPITGLFEQFVNAWHLRKLNYGDFSTSRNPETSLFFDFEKKWDEYRASIARSFKDGTPQLVRRMQEWIASPHP